MKQALALGTLFTAFALALGWLHETAQQGAIDVLKHCFRYGFNNWLNWDGIEAIFQFMVLTALIFLICEKLPKIPRVMAALLLPVLVAYFATSS